MGLFVTYRDEFGMAVVETDEHGVSCVNGIAYFENDNVEEEYRIPVENILSITMGEAVPDGGYPFCVYPDYINRYELMVRMYHAGRRSPDGRVDLNSISAWMGGIGSVDYETVMKMEKGEVNETD